MARVDIPTLQCDRCGCTTQDIKEMASYNRITHYHMSGHDDWDLCPSCWTHFKEFVEDKR